MSDDLERRLRAALHDASLPGAPSSLRSALLTVPDAAAAKDRQTPRWQRLPLALAAALIIGVAGVAGLGVLGKLPVGPVGPSPSDLLAPPASVQVLDATQLAAAIAAQRAGGLEPQVVVTSVRVDANMLSRLTLRECGQPIGSCAVIGVLDGMHDPDGTVTIRMPAEGSGDLPTPTTAADLAGPVALRLAGMAPIEFLGHVDLQGPAGQVDVPALLAATTTARAGEVRAVDGWLVGISAPSCGPVMPSGLPLPAPFACPSSRSILTASPVAPVVPEGSNGFRVVMPADAVPVQAFAYESYAPSPASDGMNAVPRRGLYLVRMVAVDTAECPACRGWLIVGRLDVAPAPAAAPTPSAESTSNALYVLSAAQAADFLATLQRPLGRPLAIDGQLALDATRNCAASDAWCVLGHLDGTNEPVFAASYTMALMPPDYDYTSNRVMAFVVESTGLQFLGYIGYHDGVSFEFPMSSLTDLTQQPRGPMVVAVRGWLVAGPPMPCPAPLPGTPPNTPFVGCPGAWLTPDAVQPWFWNGDQIGYRQPDRALLVQYGAYRDFAPNPVSGSDGFTEPRYGTYLVRLVTDTREPEATAPRGWQVIGRLDPEPVLGPPLDAPLPSLPPKPSPTPVPSPVITCVPQPNPSFGGDPCPSAIEAALGLWGGGYTVTRLYLEPGIFPCGEFWRQGAVACAGPIVRPGTAMRGWIAFAGTDKVAAIQLRRTPPTAGTPQPPWDARLSAFAVPPAGWSMPMPPR
jgi:hypothetical protein